jgi:hypothetical protein
LRRDYVVKKVRDGNITIRKGGKDYHQIGRLTGNQAANKRIPRYANPWVGDRARSWTYGWNIAHGECESCELCLVGTEKVDYSLEDYVKWHLKKYGYFKERS